MVTILICLPSYCCFPQHASMISWYFSYEQVSKGKFQSLDCRFVNAVPSQSGPWGITISLGSALPLLKTSLVLSAPHMLSFLWILDFELWFWRPAFFPFFFCLRSWLLTLVVLVHCILLKFDCNHPSPYPVLANNALWTLTTKLERLLAVFSWFLKTISQLIRLII